VVDFVDFWWFFWFFSVFCQNLRVFKVLTDLASLVFLAGSIVQASFVIETSLRPPGSLELPTYV